MTHKTYIVNLTINNTNLYNFEQDLKSNPYVLAYWNYIPLVYCLKSTLDSAHLAQLFGKHFPGGGFLIAEINSFNVNGLLPKDAWDWFVAPSPVFKTLLESLQPGSPFTSTS